MVAELAAMHRPSSASLDPDWSNRLQDSVVSAPNRLLPARHSHALLMAKRLEDDPTRSELDANTCHKTRQSADRFHSMRLDIQSVARSALDSLIELCTTKTIQAK